MPDKTILFADDSATMRTIVEKTFLAEPYEVVVVPSGEAAIAKARELKPDIVIADGGLVGASGYDVCKAVRGDASLSSIPVIIMSGVSNPYDEALGKSVGANGHVKKPFDTTKLIEQVGELTAGAVAPAPEVAVPAATAPKPAPTPPPVVAPAPKAAMPAVTLPQPAPAPTAVASSEKFDEISEPIELVEDEPIQDIPIEDEVVEAEPGEAPEEDAFQVSTLAEMAQMDEQGDQSQPDTNSTEVALTPDDQASKKEPAKQLPIEEAIQEQALAAAESVTKEVKGVSAQQLETIQKLTAEVIERVVWEVVPELAEAIIKEEISKLLEE